MQPFLFPMGTFLCLKILSLIILFLQASTQHLSSPSHEEIKSADLLPNLSVFTNPDSEEISTFQIMFNSYFMCLFTMNKTPPPRKKEGWGGKPNGKQWLKEKGQEIRLDWHRTNTHHSVFWVAHITKVH